jgi:hypothetical protein
MLVGVFPVSWGGSTLSYRWKGYDNLAPSPVNEASAPGALDQADRAPRAPAGS